MTDEHDSELMLRASAYLDGEADADERERAESDPAVMAEVARLRELQAALRQVEPATSQARESAIGAALREFDLRLAARQASATAPAAPARVAPFRPRPSYTRWLGAAAAVLAVGVLGVVIGTAGSGDDDDAASVAPEAALDTQAGGADAAESAERTVAGSSVTEPASGAAVLEQEVSTSAADVALAEAAPSVAASPTPATAFDPDVPILDELALTAAGAQLLAMESQGTLGPTPETSCGGDAEEPLVVLGQGLYALPDRVVPVLLAIERSTADTFAIDPETCEIVATGR